MSVTKVLPLIAATLLAIQPVRPLAQNAATVHGLVTDLDSGEPIAGALVKLGPLGTGDAARQTVTNREGSYSFAGLTAGSYRLHVEPPAGSTSHVSRAYRQSVSFDPRRFDSWMTPLRLSPGDDVDVPFQLPRALAIAGRVVGPDAQPIGGMRLVVEDANGNVVLRAPIRSDAEGRFRINGLHPGGYRICADPGMNVALVRSTGRNEGNQPLKTCVPSGDGTLALGAAGVSDVEVSVRYGPVFNLAGTVVDSTGAPLPSRLVELRRSDGTSVASVDVHHAGSGFVIRGVPSGAYVLSARRQAADGRPLEVGSIPIVVNAADVQDVRLRTEAPVSIVGRIEFAEGRPAVKPIVTVNTVGVRNTVAGPGARSSHVRDDLTFTLDALLGPQRLQVFGAMRPWTVKTITSRGKDVFGRAVTFAGSTNPDDLVIVLTNRSASVAARLRALAAQQLPPAAMVALIPLDASGTPLENVELRPIEAEGPFGLPPVRPGDYLVAAVAPEDTLGPQATVIRRIARVAQRLTLAPGEHRTLELEIVSPK